MMSSPLKFSEKCSWLIIVAAGLQNVGDNFYFGGVKSSGLGRELSTFILEELSETKQICIDISKVKE